jgi:AraC family ethanolamine operon transcriptional activator
MEVGGSHRLETAFENAYAVDSIAWAQLEPGGFHVRYGVLDMPMINVSRREISVSTTFAADVAPDRALIGLVADCRTQARFFGIGVDENSIAASRSTVELTSVGPSSFYTLVVDESELQRQFPSTPDAMMLLEVFKDVKLSQDPVSANRLREWLDELFLPRMKANGIPPRPSNKSIVGTVIPLMSSAIRGLDSHVVEAPKSLTRRIAAVRECVTFMTEHVDSTVTLLDLSQLTGLQTRSLINAFEAVVGMSPMTYLRRLRLNGVHRDLQRRGRDQTVAAIATDWGFWHLGHFTASYQAMFGELPSQTRSNPRR